MGYSAPDPVDPDEKLQEMVKTAKEKGLEPNTTDLQRFLKARKFDVQAALDMFESSNAWRLTNNIDIMLDKADPNEITFQTLAHHCLQGHDREGRPIYWEKTGSIVQVIFFSQFTNKELVDRHIRRMETQTRRMQESTQTQHTLVLDLTGFSVNFDPRGLQVFKETVQIDQNYYPERLGHFFLFNTPWMIYPIWSLISPFIDPLTLQKFHLLGTDYQTELKKYVSEENLPVEYGGTMVWPSVPHDGMSSRVKT